MGKINFDRELSVIVVDVFIEHNGIQKKVRMALDTGATYVMIPWEVAEILSLQPQLLQEKIDMVTASGVEKVPIATLSRIKVNKSEAHNVKAIVHDLPSKSYVDGLLGLSFLRNFNVHLDFKEGILEIK
ncbi:retroviral-like aspartic protease family protein [Candidatus Pacearchaeota archaeon]|nr:retroviral-like aspartic protease family protein [Candidatus Pacearchaeota archaeon]